MHRRPPGAAALRRSGRDVCTRRWRHDALSRRRRAASPSPSSTPTWQLTSYRRVGFDQSFKADLIDELPAPPELVVFGGSRATRFEPSYLASLTGLSAFNAAVQCFRPEDAWAFSNYLYSRAPETSPALHHRPADAHVPRRHPACGPAVRPAPGERVPAGSGRPPEGGAREAARQGTARRQPLSRPGLSGPQPVRRRTRASRVLVPEAPRSVHPAPAAPSTRWDGPLEGARSRTYFEKTVRLFNDHDVVPLIVVMPYQPRALRAFRRRGLPEAPRPSHGVSP